MTTPISKEERIMRELTEREIVVIPKAQSYIDGLITLRYRPLQSRSEVHIGYLNLIQAVKLNVSRAFIELLIICYRAQGWTVEYIAGNEDNWLIFS